MRESILVPFDGSVLAERALEFAFEEFPEAEVVVLHVVEIPAAPFGSIAPEARPPISERAVAYAESVLDSAEAIADKYDRAIATEVDRGKPEHRIVEHALDGAFDLIVVGSHGRGGIAQNFVGSVAESVVHRSPIPVLVVK